MAISILQTGLNPWAPEYIPLNTGFISGDVVSAPYPSFYYTPTPPPPPPPPSTYFPPYETHLYYSSESLYTTSFSNNEPILIPPQNHHLTLLTSPAPPPPFPITHLPPPATSVQNEETQNNSNQRVETTADLFSNTKNFRKGWRNNNYNKRWVSRRADDGIEGCPEYQDKRNESRPCMSRSCSYGDQKASSVRVVKYCKTGKNGQRVEVLPVKADGNMTTVMIRNIPNKYTRAMLLRFLDEHCVKENENMESMVNSGELKEQYYYCRSAIDFVYMPIDFKTGWSKSYAFVNFAHPRAVWKFYKACHNQKWELCQSNKIREIACAKIQGREALVKHFGNTAFACESDEYLPVCFNPPRDGTTSQLTVCTVVGKRILP